MTHKHHSLLTILLLWLTGTVLAPVQAQSVITPDRPVLALDEIGLYHVGYKLRTGAGASLPTGWTGGFDAGSHGMACQPQGVQNGREAWLLHCPWQGGTGVAFQEYTVRLPRVPKITLSGATALRADAVGKSDGVTFRVFVDGRKLLDENRTDAAWRSFTFDLTPEAGHTVTLRFETDPGPQDNPSFDFSLWGDRQLVLAGFHPAQVRHPAPPPLDLRRLVSVRSGSVAPPSGFVGRTSCQVAKGEAVFRYTGADGTLEYHWRPPAASDDPVLGRWTLRAQMVGDKPVEVPLIGQARVDWADSPQRRNPPRLVPRHPSRNGKGDRVRGGRLSGSGEGASAKGSRLSAMRRQPSQWSQSGLARPPLPFREGCPRNEGGVGSSGPPSATLTQTFDVDGQAATLTTTAHLEGKSLVIEVACDKPLIRGLDGGGWGPTLRRKAVAVPYYSQPVTYLPRENLFVGALLDWTHSNASAQAGTRATYEARTDGTRNPLKERLVYTAAWHLAETLPNIPNPPSPYRKDLSNRVVLDSWGDSFPHVQAHLHDLAAQGLGPAVLLLHVWQRSGYDNALPAHVPANAEQGGDTAMAALVKEGERDGVHMALHENYVDYYPNYEGFTGADIAKAPDGSRINAWYNSGTKIQSFAVKPTRILPLARTQSPEIVKRYGSDACYLDVHSAVPPWFHVDADASQNGAGTFRAVWDAHRQLWAYERQLHHGPVFGEGNNHWYWSGLLDGVEAQFGQGWPDGQGTSAPLLVDFDLLKIHPLQLNHGMGYYERWWAHGPGPDRSLLSLLDQYRMQEAVFGHEAFLGGATWADPGLSWLEARLLTPLTSRTALARPVAIDYLVNGRWLDTTAAAKAGADWSRVRVRYDNGVTVWGNGGIGDLTPQPPLLQRGGAERPRLLSSPLSGGEGPGVRSPIPPHGWWAEGAGLRAGTTRRDGIVSDYAETPDGVFVNARPAADWETPGQTRIRPSVATFTPTGPRSFRATYRWDVGQALAGDYNCFVHFIREGPDAPNEGIRFQQDHALPRPTSQWKPGEAVTDGPYEIRVPETLAPGDYQWTTGLFLTGGGRPTLQGVSDGHGRILLGTLHVGADAVSFTPQPPPAADVNTPINAIGKVLDFGPVRTNGSAWVHREGGDWVLRPFPRDRPFTLDLAAARFGTPKTVQCIGGASAQVTPNAHGAFWRLPLNGAREYRWPAAR